MSASGQPVPHGVHQSSNAARRDQGTDVGHRAYGWLLDAVLTTLAQEAPAVHAIVVSKVLQDSCLALPRPEPSNFKCLEAAAILDP